MESSTKSPDLLGSDLQRQGKIWKRFQGQGSGAEEEFVGCHFGRKIGKWEGGGSHRPEKVGKVPWSQRFKETSLNLDISASQCSLSDT